MRAAHHGDARELAAWARQRTCAPGGWRHRAYGEALSCRLFCRREQAAGALRNLAVNAAGCFAVLELLGQPIVAGCFAVLEFLIVLGQPFEQPIVAGRFTAPGSSS